MTANCPTTSATPTNVTLGGSGQETFSCDTAAPTTHPAFTTGGPVLVTPTVTGLNPPYNSTGLFAYVANGAVRSEEHTSELQSRPHLVCRLLLEKKKTKK